VTQDNNIRSLHNRLGKIWNQPISVGSFTNKRLTINYRAPLHKLQQLIPQPIVAEEIGDTGMGMISQCVCDFHVNRFGFVPIPLTHTNEMLCRVSVQILKNGKMMRAYYTLRSDTSSRIMGILGGNFSHFRKAISDFEMRDDGEVYELQCRAKDAICNGHFKGYIESLSKDKPDTTIFDDVKAATDFVYELDGSCGYDFNSGKLSFQHIDYPEWDIQFCHQYEYDFSLLNYLFETYELEPELDCVLYMEKVKQTWGTSWLYREQSVPQQEAVPAKSML
jgi:hypothetical protein